MVNLFKKIRDVWVLLPCILSFSYNFLDVFKLLERHFYILEKEYKQSTLESKEAKLKQIQEAQRLLKRLRSDNYTLYVSSSLKPSEQVEKSEKLKQEDKHRLANIFVDEIFSWR